MGASDSRQSSTPTRLNLPRPQGSNRPTSTRPPRQPPQRQGSNRHQRQQWVPVQPKAPSIPPSTVLEAKLIKNPVNLKKKTLALIKDPNEKNLYYVTFEFDSTCPCSVAVQYVVQEVAPKGKSPTFKLVDSTSKPNLPRRYNAGLKQKYKSLKKDSLDLSRYSVNDLLNPKDNTIPIIIEIEVEDADKETKKQITYARLSSGTEGYNLRVDKQKIQIGTQCVELHEIYGVGKGNSMDGEELDGLLNGRECVICLAADRDTTLVPCRHMCVCQPCANLLRNQGNKCPICRESVSSLVHMAA